MNNIVDNRVSTLAAVKTPAWFIRVVFFGVILAWFVVMLGAYTRLTHAGLGCPDWPFCYGRIMAPMSQVDQAAAVSQYQIPVEVGKAWTEMAHRYLAFSLALIVFYCGIRAVLFRERYPSTVSQWIPIGLMILIIFQALLGMLTVTLKLMPVVVMGHLLGGILIFTGLGVYLLQLMQIKRANMGIRFWIGIGVLFVFCQIVLGGWVSSNYAGIACAGFPKCNGEWLDLSHLKAAFNVFSPIGLNYQGGILDQTLRVSIQEVHRLGAFFISTYIALLVVYLFLHTRLFVLKLLTVGAMTVLVIQVILGIINAVYGLPLLVAVAHNGMAALLLLCMGMIFYIVRR